VEDIGDIHKLENLVRDPYLILRGAHDLCVEYRFTTGMLEDWPTGRF
jgi:hypothetical protein